MRAVVVHAANDLRVEEVPDPQCRADQVVVAVEWGGICGSDVAYWKTGVSGTAVLTDPLILGHEVAGHLVEVGSRVSGVRVGQRVTVHPATRVGGHTMPEEIADRTNLWPEVRYLGSAAFQPHEPGGFSSLLAVRPEQLRPLPAAVSTKDGALAEPFGVAIHAVRRAGDVSGRSVLVNGCGPIGALAIAAATAAGAAHVYAADVSEKALDVARDMGADSLIPVGAGQALPTDVEVGLEASGAAQALGGVIAAVRRGGVLVQVGNLPAGEISAELGSIVTREIDYRGSYRFVDEITDAIVLMDNTVDVSPVISHSFALEHAHEAFSVAGNHASGSSKVMLQLS